MLKFKSKTSLSLWGHTCQEMVGVERAEEAGAREGLNDLLCVQKSGSPPPPPPAPTCACAPEGSGSLCLRPRVNVKICSAVFLTWSTAARCPGDRGEVREAGPGAGHVLPLRLRGVVQRRRERQLPADWEVLRRQSAGVGRPMGTSASAAMF